MTTIVDVYAGERLSQPDVAYNAGYNACADEALRRIGQLDTITETTRQRLLHGLTAHLRRSADDDVSMTSPPMCDVTVAPRRRLFGSTSTLVDEGCRPGISRPSRRRPLADIQPSISRDPPPVCRANMATASSSTDCRFPFQFLPDVGSYGGHVTDDAFPLSTQVVSRCVTLTQTMTRLHEDPSSTTTTQRDAPGHDNRSVDGKTEPMWRPW